MVKEKNIDKYVKYARSTFGIALNKRGYLGTFTPEQIYGSTRAHKDIWIKYRFWDRSSSYIGKGFSIYRNKNYFHWIVVRHKKRRKRR